MKSTVAPLLLHVLRSRGQAEMLCAILSNPQREWTLAELAKVSRQSLLTVQREHINSRPLVELEVHGVNKVETKGKRSRK